MKIRATALLLTVLVLAALCACSPQAPTINTEPISTADDGNAASTQSTLPAPDTPMMLADVIGEMGTTMHWSALKNYKHTLQDDTTAVFAVDDGKGHTCTLTAVFSEATDLLTQATLSYGEVSVDLLTDDAMVIRRILAAMDEG